MTSTVDESERGRKAGIDDAEPAVDADALADLRSLQLESEGDLLSDLVALFLRTAPNQLGIMGCAIEENDPAALAAGAHTLKGSSANFGAQRLQNLCGEAEALARRGKTTEVAALLGPIASEFQRVMTALQSACPTPLP
jgi:HPt (histidine-containing phosphotransfer) domain-containing protein